MAFSAFRLLMSGSSSGGGPVVLTDTITPEVHALVQNQTGGGGGTATYSITSLAATGNGTGTKFFIYSKSRNGASGYTYLTWLPTVQSAGPTLTTTAGFGVGPNPSGTTVDISYNTNQGIAAVDDEGPNVATVNFVNSTNSSIPVTASHNMGQASTAIRTNAVGSSTLNVVYALLADTTSHIYLFDQSGGLYDSTATGPADVSKNMQIVSLSNTLGVLIYATSGNAIKLATYNISGSTVTMDSAVSASITAASGAKAVMIDSTHILLVYKKSANTLGARVVTVATGSTFTFNTEYTATATGITDDPIGNPGQFSTSDYGVTWINANGQGCCTLMSVSGTAITLSNPNIYHTANNVIATSDYYSSYFIGLSSTTAAIAYLIKIFNISGTSLVATKSVVVDLNFSQASNQWTTTYTGNIQSTTALSLGSANGIDMCSFGTDRYLCMQTTNGTTVTFSTIDNDYKIALTNAQNTFVAAAAVQAGSLVNIGFSGTTARALAIYGYSNTTIEARLVQVNQDGGTITIGAASTVTSAGTQTAYYTINAINYTTDKTLVFYMKATGLYAAIITTSGTSISSVANETQISSNTATNINLGLTLLDTSGNIMLGYCNNGASAGQAMIVNVSGTTITVGTPVSLGTASAANGQISSCLHTSNRGTLCFYDAPGGTPDIYVQGFTYSGTTITLGASAQNLSSWGAGVGASTGYKPQILSVGNNDAQVIYTTSSNTLRSKLLTSTGINTYSFSAQSGPGVTAANYAFLPQDSYSKASAFYGGGGINAALYNFYRV